MWITNPSCDGENYVANYRDGTQETLVGHNTDFMLPLPYERYWHSYIYDPNAISTCTNIDTVGDAYGDTCSAYYDANPTTCSYYDTSDFIST